MKDNMGSGSPVLLSLDGTNDLDVMNKLKEHIMQPRGLIGMPTETVYGLAANGLCEESVRHIFTVKGRPLTDPVILHVPSFVDALDTIFDTSLYDAFLVLLLGKRFSPGPLTIITRGKSTVPAVVSANTMFPAVRCPSHPVTQMLLKHVGVPLAAPSANKFGHISPTSAQHVISEFPDEPILVLDAGACQFGLESTVVKVEASEDLLNANEFLRTHHISYKELEAIVEDLDLDVLCDTNVNEALFAKIAAETRVSHDVIKAFVTHIMDFKDRDHQIKILRRGFVTTGDITLLFKPSVFPNTTVRCVDMFSGIKQASVSPGTLLTHYAPAVPTYLVGPSEKQAVTIVLPNRIVFIDATSSFLHLKNSFLHYFPLDRDDEKVAHELYDTLRNAESVALEYNKERRTDENGNSDNAQSEVIDRSAIIIITHEKRSTDLNATVRDRLLRACSGKTVRYRISSNSLEFLV